MGRIVKKLSDNTSKYYWYPGEKVEWVRALVALAIGAGLGVLLMLSTRNSLVAMTVGCAGTLAVTGFNFGRRDARALAGFPKANDKAARKAAISYSGRAAWRGVVKGLGYAFAAVLVLNIAHTGWIADWVMPLVPGAVGALAHQAGMAWERLRTTVAVPKPAKATSDGN